MRILWVTTGFVYPLTSGQLRHYHLVAALGRRHRITLVSLVDPGFDRADLDAVRPLVEEVLVFGDGEPATFSNRARRKAAGFAPALSPATSGMRAALARLHEREPFDVAVVSGRRAQPVLAGAVDVPLVADVCDATARRLLDGLRYRGLRAIGDAVEYVQSRRVEAALARRADRLLFASARDRDLVVAGDERARVVPNGVDLAYWSRRTDRLGSAVVFVGNLAYPPNDDAAVRLARDLTPELRRRHPGVEVRIVGRDPSRRLRAVAASSGVEVTGRVDDVRPFLEGAAVAAVPLRFAAGVQNKVLEAMAMAVPVVATPAAAGGVAVDDRTAPPLDLAGTDAELVEALDRRLRQAQGGAAPHEAARAYVEAHFDWARSASLVEQALEEAVAAHTRAAG